MNSFLGWITWCAVFLRGYTHFVAERLVNVIESRLGRGQPPWEGSVRSTNKVPWVYLQPHRRHRESGWRFDPLQ